MSKRKKKKFVETKVGSFLDDTIRGDNKLGSALNKILPAQGIREALGEIVLGAKDVAPIPQAKDAEIRSKAEKLKRQYQQKHLTDKAGLAKRLKSLSPQEIAEVVYIGYDLVDDGKLNKSADRLSPEAKKLIRLGTSLLIAGYAIYALLTGDFTGAEALNYLVP